MAPREPRSISWRCRHGYHSWQFASMDNRRMVTVPPHTAWICERVDRCRRCGLRRFSDSAPIPKRVRT